MKNLKNIKISVIVSVYNTSKFLEKCLRSIMEQNLREIEIICVNDGSTDNSLEILEKLKLEDERIIIINKKNGGLSSARNTGIRLAKGEYILHVDSDDWIEQNYFKEMYEKAKIDNSDIIISDFLIDYSNEILKYRKDNNKESLGNIESINNLFLGKGCPNVWNKLIKAKLYKENNIYHPIGISIGEDLDVISKLFYYSNKIVKVNKAFVHYMQNDNSMTKDDKNNLRKIKDIYFVLNDLEKFFEEKNILVLINELKINHLSTWIFKSKYILNDEEYKKILEEYLRLFKKIKIKNIYSKKFKIFSCILKYFNFIFIFILLWNINNLYINLKRMTKNENI